LDFIFDTQRILNIAICALTSGIAMLLMLIYLLIDTVVVVHLGVLAALMTVLCVLIVTYANQYAGISEWKWKMEMFGKKCNKSNS
jgi:hypothetical protein